jgi:hypothetical protein
MRADLMAALREHIQKQGWTQSVAAKKLGTTMRVGGDEGRLTASGSRDDVVTQ